MEKERRKPGNIVSDRTARFLLRRLRGSRDLPEEIHLPGQTESTAWRPRERDLQEELAEEIRHRLVPWFWSFFLHASVLLALLLLVRTYTKSEDLEIICRPDDEVAEFIKDAKGPEDKDDVTVIVPDFLLPEVMFPKVTPPEPEPDAVVPEISLEPPKEAPVGISTDQRDLGRRGTLLAKGGGTGKSDNAVLEGLRWLARHQHPAGFWQLIGSYRNPALPGRENRNAATAMALLAFQGYGVTPYSKEEELVDFARTVHVAWQWLLREQDEDGCFFRHGAAPNNDRFYTHGLCTIALCELLAMTKDESLRKPAQAAIDYCVKHQNVMGGWRYNADRYTADSDVSVTGWIVLALKCGESAGLTVPPKTYEEISRFLDDMARENGSQYVYRAGEGITRSMTAEALLCRQLLGWHGDDWRVVRGLKSLVDPEGLPTFVRAQRRDVYYWYYATNALYHAGGESWKTWNDVMRDDLVRQQVQTGAEKGSWDPTKPTADIWGNQYGRHYTTCFSILVLEVYYRYAKVHEAGRR